MAKNEKKADSQGILRICDKWGKDKNALLPILQAVEEEYGVITIEAIEEVASFLKMKPNEVYGVATFYSFLHPEKIAKFKIRLCKTISCDMAGKELIAKTLEKELGISFGETTKDKIFSLEYTNCIGMCDQGPALLVNEKVFSKVTPDMVKKIIKECKEEILQKSIVNKSIVKFLSDGAYSNIKPEEGLKKAIEIGRGETIKTITDSGLKGRGGAGFPTGVKWNLTSVAKGGDKYVVCNADEGEPGTFKDRIILSEFPNLLFEGMTIAGYAIGAKRGILYLRGEYKYLLDELNNVLEKRKEENLLGKNILGKDDFSFDIEIKLGSGAYVCGEETALIESLEGKRGEPRNRPPFPVNTGYLGSPTVVNNVETLALSARIIAKGSEWFKKFGTEKSTGTKLFSVSGDCEKPGIYELPFGITINELLKTVEAKETKAVVIGGASGYAVPLKDFERKIAYEDVSTGGSVMVFGKNRNMLEGELNFMEFFVEESCGQCTPCRLGNVHLLEGIKLLKSGRCSQEHLKDLKLLCQTMRLTSKCGLGQSSPNAFLSIIENFPEDLKTIKESEGA